MKRTNGWDERDYKLWSALHQLPSYGLASGAYNKLIILNDVIRLLDKSAQERFEAAPTPELWDKLPGEGWNSARDHIGEPAHRAVPEPPPPPDPPPTRYDCGCTIIQSQVSPCDRHLAWWKGNLSAAAPASVRGEAVPILDFDEMAENIAIDVWEVVHDRLEVGARPDSEMVHKFVKLSMQDYLKRNATTPVRPEGVKHD
jgi:hypothetical protein